MVEVTQEDRDAAADLLAMAETIVPGGNDAAAVRNGIVLKEFRPFVQAVAAHRQAGVQQGLDMAAGVADEHCITADNDVEQAYSQATIDIAAAIRKLGCDDA